MAEKKTGTKKESTAKSKGELFQAVNQLSLDELERQAEERTPAEKIEERKRHQTLHTAENLSALALQTKIAELRNETSGLLNNVSDQFQHLLSEYMQLKDAVKVKTDELSEIYNIQKNASSLSALFLSQQELKSAFEQEMEERRTELNEEIARTRKLWEEEKSSYQSIRKEQQLLDTKQRDREKEDFRYQFEREQQIAREKFETERRKLEQELATLRETTERSLSEREHVVTQKEHEFAKLKSQVETFPKELEEKCRDAVMRATEFLKLESEKKETLLRAEFFGEKNVLQTKIEGLEKALKEENMTSTKLSQQIEKAYTQVQDVAIKAIDGSSQLKTLTPFLVEQVRKSGEKGTA